MVWFDCPRASKSMRGALIALSAASLPACSSGDGTAPGPGAHEEVDYKMEQLAVGGKHACAVASGRLYCWGANHRGQLGDGSTEKRLQPVLVPGLSDVVEVTTGGAFTCALTLTGKVYCFGSNWKGQLGDGTYDARHSPTEVPGLEGVEHITAGTDFTCALHTSGDASCWGANGAGQLGTGEAIEHSPSPGAVAGSVKFTELRAGPTQVCALATDAALWCWGSLGFQYDASGHLEPTVVSAGAGSAEVAPGMKSICVRKSDGSVQCWGSNGSGQLGDGSRRDSSFPVDVLLPAAASRIAAGIPVDSITAFMRGGFRCAALVDGRAACWGVNGAGQLGDGTTETPTAPVLVSGLSNVVDIAPSGLVTFAETEGSTCALTSEGDVWCWGRNDEGQLGNGTTEPSLVPQRVVF